MILCNASKNRLAIQWIISFKQMRQEVRSHGDARELLTVPFLLALDASVLMNPRLERVAVEKVGFYESQGRSVN